MQVRIEPTWLQALNTEFEKPYFSDLASFIREQYQIKTIYPPGRLIFNAFNSTPFDKIKVVILGQDPYHGPNQANGLAFSVADHVPIPPSLQNIYKELHSDLGIPPKKTGNLESWAKQGVLLLNATLTVQANTAGSHQKKGWEQFTDAVVHLLQTQKQHLVFILWGSYAQKKGSMIDPQRHLVLKSAHPSPLSAHNGFFGSRPFSQTNLYLSLHGQQPIDW